MGRLLVVAALLVVASCGDEPSADPADLQAVRADIVAQAASASPLQREILSDGMVTEAEAKQAVAAFVECAQKEGLTIGPTKESGNYSFGFQSDGDSQDELVIYDRCEAETFGLVGMMLGVQAAPPADALEERNSLVEQCLIDEGFDAEGWPATTAELDPSVEARCVDEADAAVGAPSPQEDTPPAELEARSFVLSPNDPQPGDVFEATFDPANSRGGYFVLSQWDGTGWDEPTFLLESDVNRPTPTALEISGEFGVNDYGAEGPGPDGLIMPDQIDNGLWRLCTANARDHVCAQLTINQ